MLGVLGQRGWRDRATRLLLFDTFVKTTLLYGCAVWGSHLLPRSCLLSQDYTGSLGTFYRRALRTLLGVGRVRNEVLYVLSGCLPLQVYIAKAMWRYARGLIASDHLAARMARWAWGLEATGVA